MYSGNHSGVWVCGCLWVCLWVGGPRMCALACACVRLRGRLRGVRMGRCREAGRQGREGRRGGTSVRMCWCLVELVPAGCAPAPMPPSHPHMHSPSTLTHAPLPSPHTDTALSQTGARRCPRSWTEWFRPAPSTAAGRCTATSHCQVDGCVGVRVYGWLCGRAFGRWTGAVRQHYAFRWMDGWLGGWVGGWVLDLILTQPLHSMQPPGQRNLCC